MRFDVDWVHGALHMWDEHEVSVPEAFEALADVDALLFDPDPKSKSGISARVIGYSQTASSILVIILVRRDEHRWWGANGWRANSSDRRIYWEEREL